jgi:hypothetical protein
MITLNIYAIEDTAKAMSEGRSISHNDVLEYIYEIIKLAKKSGFQIKISYEMKTNITLWSTKNKKEFLFMLNEPEFWDWMESKGENK